MKILVLMDSFKGSLKSTEAGNAVKEGIIAALGSSEVKVYPYADGGEGTLDAFLASDSNSKKIEATVSGPLNQMVRASYGILEDGTAVIEMAQAAGLCLLSEDERNPMHTTTKGVGELIRHAVESGCRKFIIAIGGSATNDCGTGMLNELGIKILNDKKQLISTGAKGLAEAASVNETDMIPDLKKCSFIIASDVKNPLFGEHGASYVFAPQKGALPEDVYKMDKWMKHFSEVVRKQYPDSDPMADGAGAAGGMGYALMTFLGGIMQPGADVLLTRRSIENDIRECDLVITGEGRIDGQTAMGKAPVHIAALAKKYGKSVIAICGSVGDGAEQCHKAGIDAIFPIIPGNMSVMEAMKKETASANIRRTAEEVIRTLNIYPNPC